jgi:WD40 repeat protein
MPRPERPLEGLDGPIAQLADDLRRLRDKAGRPGYREMAVRANYSSATLSAAASGRRLPTLEVTLAYVAACGGDTREWERRWREAERLTVAPYGDPAPANGHGRSPYPGLATFQPEDTDLFFGRADLVNELVHRLSERRFLAVFGPSGAGKSSLVRAGLVPAVGGPAMVLTPGAHPMAELAVHLARHAGLSAGGLLDELRQDPARASLLVRQGLSDRPDADDLLVVVDQFEEMFASCGDPAERSDFVAALLATCLQPDGRARVVLAVRADHYARFTEHPELLAALADAQVLIGGMSPAQLRQVVTKPAELCGARVEGALVATVVAEVADSPGALPLAAHALREAWHRRQGAMVTLAGYQAAGGVAGAVAHTAEQTYECLSEPERDVAQRVLLRMVDVGPDGLITRRRLSRAELDTIERAPAVVEAFTAARLVSTDRDTAEITHEALIRAWPRLNGWVEESRAGLRLHRQLTEAAAVWTVLNRDEGALYRGLRLSTTLEAATAAAIDPAGVEREFLEASQALRDREARVRQRRTRRLFTGLVAGLAFVVAVASVAVWQWRTAVTAEQMALSRQLAAESAAQLTTNPDLAALLAVHAYRISPTTEATAGLYAAAAPPVFRHFAGHTGEVYGVAYSPDGQYMATAGSDATVRVWDLGSRKSRTLTGHTSSVTAVAYSPDGRHLASTGHDATVRVWDLATGQSRALTGHPGPVTAVAYSPDGRHLVASGSGGTVRVWDLVAGQSRVLTGLTGPRAGVAYSPDGQHLAGVGEDAASHLWDLATGRSRAPCGQAFPVSALAYSPEGTHVASVGNDATVRICDLATGRSRTLNRSSARVSDLEYSPDGRHLAIAGSDTTVRVWNVATGQSHELTGHTGPVNALAYSPDGQHLAIVGATVRVWDLIPRRSRTLTGHAAPLSALAYSPDGRQLVTADNGPTVRTWDLATGQSQELTGHTGPLSALAYSPDGQQLASVGDGIKVRDLATGKVRQLTGYPDPSTEFASGDPSTALAYSSDGRQLAIARNDATVQVWDPVSGWSHTLTGHSGPVTGVAFSPGGLRLASAGHDATVRVWDLASGQSRVLAGHSGPVTGVAFSPDGLRLASAGHDATVRVWDAASGHSRVLAGHTGPVTAVAFSPDGRQLASAGHATVRVWDVASGQSRVLTGHTGPVTAVAYSPDGRLLASVGHDATVRLSADTAPTPAAAIDRICGSGERDLTAEERETYLSPADSDTRSCPPKTG